MSYCHLRRKARKSTETRWFAPNKTSKRTLYPCKEMRRPNIEVGMFGAAVIRGSSWSIAGAVAPKYII
jgi:hypothetical protein